MKKLIAIALAASALAALASTADARPHHRERVCFMRHHHRVCSWR
jgi:hypothetical protein